MLWSAWLWSPVLHWWADKRRNSLSAVYIYIYETRSSNLRLWSPSSLVLINIYIIIYPEEEGSQYKYKFKYRRRASVRAETRTYGTDSPSRWKSRALSIMPLHHPQERWLNDGLNIHIHICMYIYICICWPIGLKVTIFDSRAGRHWRRKFKSGCLPIFLYVFSAVPQRIFVLLYILVSVPTLWTQGNCLGWGPSDRTGLAGLSTTGLWIVSCERYKACHDASFFKLAEWFSSYHLWQSCGQVQTSSVQVRLHANFSLSVYIYIYI